MNIWEELYRWIKCCLQTMREKWLESLFAGKKDKRKRVYTRNRADEDIEAFLDYVEGKWDER